MITISGAFFVHPRVITLFNIWLEANKLNPTGWLSKKRVTLIYWLFVASSPLSFTKLYKLQSDGGHPKFAALIYKHGRRAKLWGYRDTSAILCNVLKYYTVVNYGPQMENLYETNEVGLWAQVGATIISDDTILAIETEEIQENLWGPIFELHILGIEVKICRNTLVWSLRNLRNKCIPSAHHLSIHTIAFRFMPQLHVRSGVLLLPVPFPSPPLITVISMVGLFIYLTTLPVAWTTQNRKIGW